MFDAKFMGPCVILSLAVAIVHAEPRKLSHAEIRQAQDDDFDLAFGFGPLAAPDAIDDVIGAGETKAAKRAKEAAKAAIMARRKAYTAMRDPVAEEASQKGEPIDASQGWWLSNGVRVSIAGVQVNNVKLGTRRGVEMSPEKMLIIAVRVNNLTETRKFEFTGWGNKNPTVPTDNFGNTYRPLMFNGAAPYARSVNRAMHPKDGFAEHLVFEIPIDKAEWLNLELAAENFGGKGTIKFKIPRTMIR